MTNIRGTVARLLRENGIDDPPIPVEQICRAFGAEIRREPFNGDVSGALIRESDRIVIGVNALHARTRQRFTIAHEFGHLILHKGHLSHFDRAPFRINLRNTVSSQAVDPEEIEANQFAAEILMPFALLKRDLSSLADRDFDVSDDEAFGLVQMLAQRYEVSIQAMAIRLSSLGFPVNL